MQWPNEPDKNRAVVTVTLEINCLFIGLDIDCEITHSLYVKN
jgi:hypothetical protein